MPVFLMMLKCHSMTNKPELPQRHKKERCKQLTQMPRTVDSAMNWKVISIQCAKAIVLGRSPESETEKNAAAGLTCRGAGTHCGLTRGVCRHGHRWRQKPPSKDRVPRLGHGRTPQMALQLQDGHCQLLDSCCLQNLHARTAASAKG